MQITQRADQVNPLSFLLRRVLAEPGSDTTLFQYFQYMVESIVGALLARKAVVRKVRARWWSGPLA